MARKAHGTHSVVVTGSNDGTKQVSKDAWNADPTKTGFLGFSAQSAEILIATGVLAATDTLTFAGAETGTADTLDRFDNTDIADKDIMLLYATVGDTITVTHTATPAVAGQIHLNDHTNRVLSETEPLVLVRAGDYWYEPLHPKIFLDSEFNIVDEGDPTKKLILSLGGATTAKTITLISSHTDNRSITFPDATDTLVALAVAQDLTNKGIDISRVLGFPEATVAIATGALAGTSRSIIAQAETGTADTLDTVTGYGNGDQIAIVADAGDLITVTHDVGGNDSIHLRHKINIFLSEKVPLVLERRGLEWYEVSGPEITKVELALGKPADALAVADNQATHVMDMAGKLIKVKAYVDTVSSSGLPTFQLRESSGGVDILSTALTIDASENTSETAATPAVIKSDGTEDLIADEVVRVDCDVAGTGALGAILTLWFENLSGE